MLAGRVGLRRVVDRIPADPVEFWLGRLDEETRDSDRSHFLRFLRWLRTQPGWEAVTPRDVLVRHLEAADSYEVLDLVQGYVNTLVARKSSKRKTYSAIRSFFLHNRCALPLDPSFRVRGDKPPIQPRLTVGDIVEAHNAADVRYRSLILAKWMSFMDSKRLMWTNLHGAEQIVRQIKANQNPVRIDLAGRKSGENDSEGQFYTFIGKDAVEALVKYFDEERGWPKPGEPIWLKFDGTAITKHALEELWLRQLRHIGKIPKQRGDVGIRYGYNLHEMRDVATTFLHIHAKADGLDMDCVKFWCGQVGEIDPLKYDKFYKNADYVAKQYKIAEPCLNILSNPITDPNAREKMRTLEGEVERLREKIAEQGFAIRLLQDASSLRAVQKQ